MFLAIQFIAACFLVASGAAIVLLWLCLALISSGGGLMPWTAAGILMFGLGFVGLGAFISVPGIIWAHYLAARVSPQYERLAKLPGKAGAAVLIFGLIAALAVLVVGELGTRSVPVAPQQTTTGNSK